MAADFFGGRNVAFALLFLATTSYAETIYSRVVGITDGDTITVLNAKRQQHKIRLLA